MEPEDPGGFYRSADGQFHYRPGTTKCQWTINPEFLEQLSMMSFPESDHAQPSSVPAPFERPK